MFSVQLQQFSGPLDLLVFFIQRDELDIYDIPIARIADEFLHYVHQMEQVDLDAAGEFIFFAALLIQIKSRMLLPSGEVDDEGEPLDPRRELVERLLEYVRYKEGAAALDALRARRLLQHTRPPGEAPPPVEMLPALDASSLVRALARLVKAAPAPVQHAVTRVVVTVEEGLAFWENALARAARVAFSHLTRNRTRPYVVATFLAALELARRGAAGIRLGAGHDFWLERPDA